MKKLLLGLGTLSIAILPVIAVVSCSNETTPKTDLGITAKIVEQSVIDTAVKALDTANKLPVSTPAEVTERNTAIVAALTPIFDKVTLENVINIEAVATAAVTKAKAAFITLTANEGFAFGTEGTLVSKSTDDPVVDTDLEITATGVTQELITAAADLINQKAPATEAKIIEALQTVFTGVTKDNFKNFVATTTGTANEEVITLTANEGFAFVTAKTLVSTVA